MAANLDLSLVQERPWQLILTCLWLHPQIAWAHVRGGGELGRPWHAAARWSAKGAAGDRRRATDDYLASARYLMDQCKATHLAGYATSAGTRNSHDGRPERSNSLLYLFLLIPWYLNGNKFPGFLALGPTNALSPPAGALLLGSALSRSPELFSVAVLRVPFLDALTCMMDPRLPLTAHERDEWGDPVADAAAFKAIREMCPYQQILSAEEAPVLDKSLLRADNAPQVEGSVLQEEGNSSKMPPVLVSCSLDDSRVPWWAAAKWVAAARWRQQKQVDPEAGQQQGQLKSVATDGVRLNGTEQERGKPPKQSEDSGDLKRGLVLLRVKESGGHFGSAEQQGPDLAEDYAFLLRAVHDSYQ